MKKLVILLFLLLPAHVMAANATILVVGGGGAGGGAAGGGGGGGGYSYVSSQSITAGTYTVTVGAGGAAGSSSTSGGDGGTSSIVQGTGTTATVSSGGGGGGGAGTDNQNAHNGLATNGSGGGGGNNNTNTNGGTGSGAGSAGGTAGNNGANMAGGGGGSGGTGGNNNASHGGNGGAGTANALTGSSVTYAGGGGGGGTVANNGGTGSGGAGVGGGNGVSAGDGTANTGGGGGGQPANGSSVIGAGGSGIVIVSASTTDFTFSYSGSSTSGTNGADTWIRMTGSGTLTLTAAGGGGVAITTLQYLTYTSDALGNITKVVDTSGGNGYGTTDFIYDNLSRLTSASSTLATLGNWLETFTYDTLGNLTNKSDLGNYSYSSTGFTNPHAATQIGSTNYTYDNAGNLLTGGNGTATTTNTWNYRNRLTDTSANGTTTHYAYDENDQRVQMDTKRGSQATTTRKIFNPYYETETDGTNSTTTINILLPDGTLLATVEGNGSATTTSVIHTDHLGSTNVVSNETGSQRELNNYYPYGAKRIDEKPSNNSPQTRQFIGQVYDDATQLSYLQARFYNGANGKFLSQDPMFTGDPNQQRLLDPQSLNSYSYASNDPINKSDPDGREPVKAYVGTVAAFAQLLNGSPNKVGQYTGSNAQSYLSGLGNTQWTWKGPQPTQTAYFNNKEGRYIYTESGGWVDMSHFMFYAGRAYQYKQDGAKDPVANAVRDGFRQEFADKFFAPQSAYSYEDLPSDKFGAQFGANYFDPNSKATFAEQVQNYLNNVLKATNPKNAPNYDNLPASDSKNKPSQTNKTTTPVNTKQK